MSRLPAVGSLEQLRAVVDLGARKNLDRVPDSDVLRQERTVLRALELLRDQPGVVLADEVGMGKTFEALGVAAAFRRADPVNRVVVLTPGPDLNTKWAKEIDRFSGRLNGESSAYRVHDFGERVEKVKRLGELVRALRAGAEVVVAPVSGFVNDPGAQQMVLSLYCHWKQVPAQTRAAIFRRYREGRSQHVDITESELFPGVSLSDVEPLLGKVFASSNEEDGDAEAGLDEAFETWGLEAFSDRNFIRRVLDIARFKLAGELIPDVALLVVDEAHKLKNANTGRALGVTTVFHRRFQKALFLTATPFQLDVGELRQVFRLFSHARLAPDDLMAQTAGLFEAIREYQARYDDFQRVWASLDEAGAAEIRLHFERDPEPTTVSDAYGLSSVADRYRELTRLKDEAVEPQLRRWMIRSLREDKRQYRDRRREPKAARGPEALPFLLYERLIAELFRVKSPTHKAAVQINLVSSYGAARAGSLLAEETPDATPSVEAYRQLLKGVLNVLKGESAEHPKMQFVINDALQSATQGEKTLVFCSRRETLRELARHLRRSWEARLLTRWQKLYPGTSRADIFGERGAEEHDTKGRHATLQARFRDANDLLYLALRERYVQTALTLTTWPEEHVTTIAERANQLLALQRITSSTQKPDYRVAKRCIEQATAQLWRELEPKTAADYQEPLRRLCHPDYIRLGYDLEADPLEEDRQGEHAPQWSISEDVTMLVVGYRRDLWGVLSGNVCDLPDRARIDLVERLVRYLVLRQVPFLVELLESASAAGLSLEPVGSKALLDFLEKFWVSPAGRRWVERLAAFVDYYVAASQTIREELLAALERASFVRHTAEGESREKLREAFNTPLFPMVLVANEVMQEGLDLHKNCRRVVHHDLAWNPAQLEQRVGRVDRLGSRTARLREKDPSAMLDVLYPLIKGTIDERLYRSVQAREKWLEFLLGAPPDFQEYWLGEGESRPLPEGMAERLKIELGVDAAAAG